MYANRYLLMCKVVIATGCRHSIGEAFTQLSYLPLRYAIEAAASFLFLKTNTSFFATLLFPL